MKIASHTQNLIRRMKNTSEEVSMEQRLAVINEFNQQLAMLGWGKELRRFFPVLSTSPNSDKLYTFYNSTRKFII